MKFVEVWLVGKSLELVKGQNDIRERETSTCWTRSPYRPWNFQNVDFKRSTMYPCLSSLESRLVLRMKRSYEEQARAYRINWGIKRQSLVDMGELYYSSSTHMWNLVRMVSLLKLVRTPLNVYFTAFKSIFLSLSLCTYYLGWLSCLISFERSQSNCEERGTSEHYKKFFCVNHLVFKWYQSPNCKLAIILFSFSVYPFAHGTEFL